MNAILWHLMNVLLMSLMSSMKLWILVAIHALENASILMSPNPAKMRSLVLSFVFFDVSRAISQQLSSIWLALANLHDRKLASPCLALMPSPGQSAGRYMDDQLADDIRDVVVRCRSGWYLLFPL